MAEIQNIELLIEKYGSDIDDADFIFECLKSFEDYHDAIYTMEIKMKIYSAGLIGTDKYQAMVQEGDKARTSAHNTVISNVEILNRLAKNAGIPPVYDGVVSKEKPYRRELANAVLKYVEKIIADRM